MTDRAQVWAERAHRELAARGHRSGGARALVIEALAQGDGCLSARDLHADLGARGRPVGAASVYRALGALEDAGLARHVDLGAGERRWELNHADGAHHHHLVCERCGRATAFSDDAIEHAIERLADRVDASVTTHEVVLYGTCGRCGAAARA